MKVKKINKPATIFDHLANITWKKKPWSELTELDQKSFSPYLINRWLSMNPDLIEIVDMFQQYTIGPLNKKHVYQLYFDVLPKAKMFAKYIKGKKSKKYDEWLLKLLCNHFQCSRLQSIEYIELIDKQELKVILEMYGTDKKQINKVIK